MEFIIHGHESMLVKDLALRWHLTIKHLKNNECNDEKKDADVCGHNYDEDHGPFLNNRPWEIRVFITCGCENKAAGLTIKSNLDYIESFSLRQKN